MFAFFLRAGSVSFVCLHFPYQPEASASVLFVSIFFTSRTRQRQFCLFAFFLRAGRVIDGQIRQSGKIVWSKSIKGVCTLRVPFLVMLEPCKFPPTGIEIPRHTECAYTFGFLPLTISRHDANPPMLAQVPQFVVNFVENWLFF